MEDIFSKKINKKKFNLKETLIGKGQTFLSGALVKRLGAVTSYQQ